MERIVFDSREEVTLISYTISAILISEVSQTSEMRIADTICVTLHKGGPGRYNAAHGFRIGAQEPPSP